MIDLSFLLGILASSRSSKFIDLGHLLGLMREAGGGRGAAPMEVEDASFLLQQVMKWETDPSPRRPTPETLKKIQRLEIFDNHLITILIIIP